MKKLYINNNAKKLAAYSAMAGAFVSAASSADAQVTYVDLEPDEELEIGAVYFLDMDDNGDDDFLFQVASTSGGSWSFARVFGSVTTSAYSFGNSTNRVVGYSGAFLPYGSALDEDEVIDEDADFLETYAVAFLASIYGGITYGAFADQDDKYLGVKFDIDGEVHYGWIRLDATVGPVSATLKDYAYQATAETAINTAQTEDPVAINTIDPSKLSIYSYGNTVNLVVNNLNAENGEVKIFNMQGQVIFTAPLNAKGMQITMPFAAEGTYTVKATSVEGVMSQQVFLSK
ncbi:MAG: T9SS type A sorting domain-containing protein [Chitinophagales bacterium]